jgi:hypothetical protein
MDQRFRRRLRLRQARLHPLVPAAIAPATFLNRHGFG